MTRYIDADALRERWVCLIGDDFKASDFVYAVDEAPTIEAVPVSYIEKHIEDNYRLADEIRAKRLYDVANSIARYAAQIKLFLDGWYEEQRGEE